MKKVFLSAAVLALMMAFTSCANEKKPAETTMDTPKEEVKEEPKAEEGVMVGGALMVPSKDIVDNAMGSADHKTLVSAVAAAGLVETLKTIGPFTVFAPTDAAFAKVDQKALTNLMKPENKSKLTSVLTYHVVPGSFKAADLTDGTKLKTVQGEELMVTVKDGVTMINGAAVTIADVISSNGVTHVVDMVLMPKKM